MDTVKKYLGILWMLLAPALTGFMGWQAVTRITGAQEAARNNVLLQWTIILCIFIPICTGFFIFGWYSFKGFYNRLPQHIAEPDTVSS